MSNQPKTRALRSTASRPTVSPPSTAKLARRVRSVSGHRPLRPRNPPRGDSRRHAVLPCPNHRLNHNRHLNANGIAHSTTGEKNELPQPDFGLHHRWRYRCRLPDVSGLSSQLGRRSLAKFTGSASLDTKEQRRTRWSPPLFFIISHCGEGVTPASAIKAFY